MTIRRRLYLSNILMIVLPAVISMLVVGLISSVLMGALGLTKDAHRGWDVDFVQDARLYADAWTADSTAGDIERSLADVIEDFPASGAALYVYREGQLIYTLGADAAPEALTDILARNDGHAYTVIVEGTGAYTLVGIQENPTYPWTYGRAFLWRMAVVATVVLAGMVCVILLVNGMLTRMIFRHIMGPLTMLSDGVQEIAEGNLSYRIQYAGKDEFAPIMDNFNDMVSRLQAMVDARQRDEENRRELIAGISHDLRTPLTSIIGYVEGLEKGVAATPAMQARYLSIIRDQADMLAHTINQLFLFTKLDAERFPMHREPVDIAGEVRDYVELVAEDYAQKGLTLSLTTGGRPMPVLADRMQLRNVLANILENSLKYGSKQDGRMGIHCGVEGGNAVITMTDNGPGVDGAALERMFTVFYRGDASRQNLKDGSGLGLAISARIIQRLGGTISAANVQPNGLSIRISLPCIKEGDSHAEDIDC